MRAGEDADVVDVLLVCAAALTADVRFVLSLSDAFAEARPYVGSLGLTTHVEDAARAATRVATSARVRVIGAPESLLRDAARAAGVHLESDPVVTTGRIELLRVHREQALSLRWQRYGSLAAKALLPPLGGG